MSAMTTMERNRLNTLRERLALIEREIMAGHETSPLFIAVMLGWLRLDWTYELLRLEDQMPEEGNA